MLKDLLARARGYRPSYRGGLCNHLPMALIAMERMGATPTRLETYADDYLKAMEPAPAPGGAIDAGNWRTRLGEESAYADYLGFFQREVARRNARATLRAYLPELAAGLAAAAFHPMIRTAFGVIADDAEEIAVGLAYWASRHLALPRAAAEFPDSASALPRTEDPVALLDGLRGHADLDYQPDPDNLIDRELAAAAALPGFPAIAAALVIDDLTLARLRQAAALLFFAADDFNSLHAVTGLHAAGVLCDFAADGRAFAAELWRAFLALYISLDRPGLPGMAEVAAATARELPDWNRILPAAVADPDEHVIKLAFACFAETRGGGGRLYRLLAARKARLLTPSGAAEAQFVESPPKAPPAAAGG
jgi:hypothetical protein